MKQLVTPNLNATDVAGYCLRMQQKVWGAPARYACAWDAWVATQYKHEGNPPEDVSSIIWFDHWGTYGGVYGRYGHVATYVPGRGILSNPGSQTPGQKWYNTIQECARDCNATYVGWSEDINGIRALEPGENPKPEETEDMAIGAFFRVADGANRGGIYWQEMPNLPFVAINEVEVWDAYAANGNKYNNITGAMMETLKGKYGMRDKPNA